MSVGFSPTSFAYLRSWKEGVALRGRAATLLVVFALLAIFALIHFSRLDKGHGWGDDFAAYIMQARSLATGRIRETYDRLAFFFDHSTVFIAPAVYPWGFPLVLAPVYGLFGLNILTLKSVVLVFLLGTLVVVFLLYRLGLRTLQSALAVTILAISPTFLNAGTQILSDLPFMFFCLSTLLVTRCCVIGRRTLGPPWFSAALLGLCLFASYFTRSIGFVLLPTLLAAQLYSMSRAPKTQSKAETWFVDLLPYGVFFAGLILSRLTLPTAPVELAYFDLAPSSLIASISRGLPVYFHAAGTFFIGLPQSVGVGAAILAGFGMCVRFREDWIYLLFSALYLGVLLIWPFYAGNIRYLYPVLPFYIYFAFMGARFLSLIHPPGFRAFRPPLDYALALAVIVYFAYLLPPFRWPDFTAEPRQGPFGPAAQQAYGYILANVPEDAVIQANKPRVLMLLTGKQGVVYGKAKDVSEGIATHYLVRRNSFDNADAAVTNHPDWFIELFSNSEFVLYRIVGNHAQGLSPKRD
jgi:hypothetical protein